MISQLHWQTPQKKWASYTMAVGLVENGDILGCRSLPTYASCKCMNVGAFHNITQQTKGLPTSLGLILHPGVQNLQDVVIRYNPRISQALPTKGMC